MSSRHPQVVRHTQAYYIVYHNVALQKILILSNDYSVVVHI